MARSLVLDGEHLETTSEVVFPTISLGVTESQAELPVHQCSGFVWQAILPVRMGLRPLKGDENLAEVQFSRTSIDALTGGRVADRVGGKGETFDRAGGLSGRLFGFDLSCQTAVAPDVARTLVSAAPRLWTPDTRRGIRLSHCATRTKSYWPRMNTDKTKPEVSCFLSVSIRVHLWPIRFLWFWPKDQLIVVP
jgi:hypothetical protein